MTTFQKFFQLVKVDVAQRLVYGLVTAEKRDKDGETCHYETTKPEYKAVNDELGKASDGQNIMPLREMHQLKAAGAGKSIDFDDAKKEIRMCFKVVDDSTWNKVLEKVLLGFSQGGSYVKRWVADGINYYTAAPGEVSLVDNPCLPGAFIEYVKADGSTELFKTPEYKLTDGDIKSIVKALEDSLSKGVKYLAGAGHLPYTDESGKPSHSHMGAAWAALHGGYRGNKYEGPGKEQAIAHLKEIYRQEGMEPPSEKALLDDMRKYLKSIGLDDSELDTPIAKFSALIAETVGQLSAVIGGSMKPEDIKKCAAALGISEEEFTKKYIGELAKAKGLAALHGHLETMHAHHEAMHKAHDAMGGMHEKMATHIGKCMKACSAVMGSDEKEAEKAIKSLVDELKGTAIETPEEKTARELLEKKAKEGTMSEEQIQKAIADGIKKAVADLPAPDKTGLTIVPREGFAKKAAEAVAASSPFGV